MPLALEKVVSQRDRERFIELPWTLYRHDRQWVPPLRRERYEFLNPSVNPFFKDAEVELYLATLHGVPAGRIALTLNHSHNAFHNEKTGFFGMFESIDDSAVADLLLDCAADWLQRKKLDTLLGPMNLSTNHECGLQVSGFDERVVFGIPYNPPYYVDLLENWGLQKAKDLISFYLHIKKVPDYLERIVSRIKARNRFSVRTINLKRFPEEIELLWSIYNSAWSRNWGFSPMSKDEFIYSAKEMKQIVNPSLCLIAERQGEPVGFSIALPDINQALKPLNGNLFPFGWLKFLIGLRKIDGVRCITLGVPKKFQKSGIDSVLYHETYRQLVLQKIENCEMSWILEDNQPMLSALERLQAHEYRRHRIYEFTPKS
ncbi:MAG: hypothetical protein G3M78_05955 [Candidatus Nitrohelix vancouverensis]|uniref:N-acetyltransferase n=1 Tax=Candidatus Nitrohelix vancouverensis TaxID=2705534 RepID=A0A7T0G349_9BACT|nr:MAG: hypothetical protein G3M78_05955 [Candidatus Nitrohelix vancouverensis]